MKTKLLIVVYISAVAIFTYFLIGMLNTSYGTQLDKNMSIGYEIQFDINQLVEKRTENRLRKIDIMADWFNDEYRLSNEQAYPIMKMSDMEIWLQSKMGLSYKLGGKGGDSIDCSGLFGAYAHYKKKIISYNDLINHYNAEIIRQQNAHKEVEDINRGDLLYIIKDNKAVHIMYVYSIDLGKITTIEANANSGVSYQEYQFIKGIEGIFLEQNGKVWDFDITHNDLMEAEPVKKIEIIDVRPQNMELIGDFLVSSYIPTTDGMNINNGGKSGKHTASGLPLKDEYAGIVAACPKIYDIGLDGKSYTRLYIEGHGVVECRDRGGLIVMKGEINSRGNISSHNRLDLFAGLNTPKIKRGQKHANVYLVK